MTSSTKMGQAWQQPPNYLSYFYSPFQTDHSYLCTIIVLYKGLGIGIIFPLMTEKLVSWIEKADKQWPGWKM